MTFAPSSPLPVMAGYSYPPAVRTPTSQQFCQRWHPGGWHSWRHVSDGGFDRRRFRVAEIPEAIAKAFIAQVHYLGSFPAARMSFGLFTDDDVLAVSGLEVDELALIGVAVLSVPMRAQVLTNVFPDLAPYEQTLELGRFALTDSPANAESFMLSQVWQLAAAQGLRGVVSFADPFPRSRTIIDVDETGEPRERVEQVSPGHVGIAYQAAGAIACGRSTARTLLYLPRHGAVLPERSLSKIRGQESGSEAAERLLVRYGATRRTIAQSSHEWLHEALHELGAIRVRHPGNFRYAWPIGSRSQRRQTRITPTPTRHPKPATDRMSLHQERAS